MDAPRRLSWHKLWALAPRLASLKISVICLMLLLVLTAWGTVYQASYGLYAAQTRFFHSWVFWVGGFLPLPGAQSVMWLLFFNLIASMLFRVRYSWDNVGNILTHGGFLLLLAGSFVTFKFAQESYLPLAEKAVSNVSLDRRHWELAVWEEKDGPGGDFDKNVSAVGLAHARSGSHFDFSEFGFAANVGNCYRNCEAFPDTMAMPGTPRWNTVASLEPRRPALDPQDDYPGMRLNLTPSKQAGEGLAQANPEILLWGGMENASRVEFGGKTLRIALRHLRHPLPIAVKLIDVKKEEYPGTGIARAYQSDVEVRADGAQFKTRISMNHPLHYKDFTFYQSSYTVDARGDETSVFAVVENSGKLLPYVSGGMIFIGMMIHFLLMLFRYGNRGVSPSPKNSGKKESSLNGESKPKSRGQVATPSGAAMSLSILASLAASLAIASSLAGVSAASVHADGLPVKALDALKALPVQDGGRIKPLDTYARVSLLQMSARSTYGGKPAIDWLARLMFTPKAAMEDRVFRINHPDVLYSIGVEPEKSNRYSFAQLSPSISKISDLAEKALKVDEKRRTPVESEMIRVANSLSLYLGIMNSFLFSSPNSEFKVTDSTLAASLGMQAGDEPHSYMELRARMGSLAAWVQPLIGMDGGMGGMQGEGHGGREPSTWSPSEMEAYHLFTRFTTWSQHYRSFPIPMIPPEGKGAEEWWGPWGLVAMPNSDPRVKQAALDLDAMAQAYAQGNAQAFDQAVASFAGFVQGRNVKWFDPSKLKLELLYNALDAFYLTKILFGLAILISLVGLMIRNRWIFWPGVLLLASGAILQAVGIGLRVAIAGRAPVANLYETFLFVSWVGAVLGLALEFFNRKGLGILVGALTGFAVLMLSSRYNTDGDTIGVLVAVLNSNFWLSTHVITISLGYAGMCLAGVLGHLYLIQAMVNPKAGDKLQNLIRMTYAILAFGLIFSFIGTVLGGVWADQSWGRFWGWDPKENGALLIVLWGAILFHALAGKMIGPLGMAVGSILGIIVVMMAWFGINLLGVGLHSYGFTSGVATALVAYVFAEVAFIVGALLWIKGRHRGESKGEASLAT